MALVFRSVFMSMAMVCMAVTASASQLSEVQLGDPSGGAFATLRYEVSPRFDFGRSHITTTQSFDAPEPFDPHSDHLTPYPDSGSLFVEVGYAFAKDWKTSVGVEALRSGSRVAIFPLLGVGWRDSNQAGWSATMGLPSEVRYRFDQDAIMRLGVAYRRSVDLPRNTHWAIPDNADIYQRKLASGLFFDIDEADDITWSFGTAYNIMEQTTTFDAAGYKSSTVEQTGGLTGLFMVNFEF